MKSSPSLLSALFSPTRRRIGPERLLLQRGGLIGRTEWVVPRAEALYRQFDMSALPARQRAAAAGLAVLREMPARDSVARIAWTGAIAHAWIWTPATGSDRARITWIPESLLRQPPLVDGTRLLTLLEGVEGQLWRDGLLRASQWWPAMPDSAGWYRFLRGAGVSPADAPIVPSPVDIPLGRPWGRLKRRGGRVTGGERWAWGVIAGGLAFALAFQATERARLAEAVQATRLHTSQLRAHALPLVEARERADAAHASSLRYRGLQHAYNDYALMADVVAALPGDVRLLAWVRRGEKLQVALSVNVADPRKLVSAYLRHPLLRHVRVLPGTPGQAHLEFDLPSPGAP